MFKKGVSAIVATMILLVITVVLAALIMTVVVPFVKDQLGTSKECADTLDSLEFGESPFNCYSTTETGFSVKVKKDAVVGVQVSLINQNGDSQVYTIKNGSVVNGIRMKASTTPLEFPTTGGQRTYVANVQFARAEIAPLTVSDRICEVADTIQFSPCANGVTL